MARRTHHAAFWTRNKNWSRPWSKDRMRVLSICPSNKSLKILLIRWGSTTWWWYRQASILTNTLQGLMLIKALVLRQLEEIIGAKSQPSHLQIELAVTFPRSQVWIKPQTHKIRRLRWRISWDRATDPLLSIHAELWIVSPSVPGSTILLKKVNFMPNKMPWTR